MGLNTTHNCWNGPYSSFNQFRYSLAEVINIDLAEYHGYGLDGTEDLASIEHDLMPLFNHSDCDGILTVEESKRIARGLKDVLLITSKRQTDPDFVEAIIDFRDGCLDAISRNEIIEFH